MGRSRRRSGDVLEHVGTRAPDNTGMRHGRVQLGVGGESLGLLHGGKMVGDEHQVVVLRERELWAPPVLVRAVFLGAIPVVARFVVEEPLAISGRRWRPTNLQLTANEGHGGVAGERRAPRYVDRQAREGVTLLISLAFGT